MQNINLPNFYFSETYPAKAAMATKSSFALLVAGAVISVIMNL